MDLSVDLVKWLDFHRERLLLPTLAQNGLDLTREIVDGVRVCVNSI